MIPVLFLLFLAPVQTPSARFAAERAYLENRALLSTNPSDSRAYRALGDALASGAPPPPDICTGLYYYKDYCDFTWQVGWPGMGPGSPGCIEAQGCDQHDKEARTEDGQVVYIAGQGLTGRKFPKPDQTKYPLAYLCWADCWILHKTSGGYSICAQGPVGGSQTWVMHPLADVTGPRKATWMATFHCNEPTPTPTPVPTPSPNIYAAWISEFAKEGFSSGCGGGNFCPDRALTRAEMTVFILKAVHGTAYLPPPCVQQFNDVLCGSGP